MTGLDLTTERKFEWPAPQLLLLVSATAIAAFAAFEHIVQPFFMAVEIGTEQNVLPVAHEIAINLLLATVPAFYAWGLWHLAEGVGESLNRTRISDLRAGFSHLSYGALSAILIVPTVIGWIEFRGGFRLDFDVATFVLLAVSFVMQHLASVSSTGSSDRDRVNQARRALVLTAALGLLACAWFWTALLRFGALSPEYSQFTKAVSELGVIGAPDALAWNVFGFGFTGVLLAIYGWRLARLAIPEKRSAAIWLLLSGVAFAGTGVFPADMDSWSAVTTIMHLVSSFLVVIFWFMGAWSFLSEREGIARPFAIATLIVMVLTGLAFLARFAPFILPGLAQRISFGAYFMWYFASALLVLWIAPKDVINTDPVAN